VLLGGTVVQAPASTPPLLLVPLLPELVPLLPELVPLLPELVPLLPELVPLLPELVPLLPELVPLLPELLLEPSSGSSSSESFGGTVTRSSAGSVGSFVSFGWTKSVAAASSAVPSAQAARAARVPRRRAEAKEWMGFIAAPELLTLRDRASTSGHIRRRTRDASGGPELAGRAASVPGAISRSEVRAGRFFSRLSGVVA